MAEKPRFWRWTVFAKNLGFGVGFGYRNNTITASLLPVAIFYLADVEVSWTVSQLCDACILNAFVQFLGQFLLLLCIHITVRLQCFDTLGWASGL